jgi:hypothetical protein
MYSGNVTGQIEGIRQQTVTVLDETIARAGEFELADPPPALARYRKKLTDNTYKVLVVGEAKRGKSTFVNALIGRDVLPTDVDVATSQVFNIRPSQREAYRLRFEDGSEREISLEDLPLYGSQVALDAGVVPTTDQLIRLNFIQEILTVTRNIAGPVRGVDRIAQADEPRKSHSLDMLRKRKRRVWFERVPPNQTLLTKRLRRTYPNQTRARWTLNWRQT